MPHSSELPTRHRNALDHTYQLLVRDDVAGKYRLDHQRAQPHSRWDDGPPERHGRRNQCLVYRARMTLSVRAAERERARDKRADEQKKGLGHVDASPPELPAGNSGGLVVAMLTRHCAYMQRRHAIPGNMYFCTSQAKFCWEGTDRGVHGYHRRRATRETAAIV